MTAWLIGHDRKFAEDGELSDEQLAFYEGKAIDAFYNGSDAHFEIHAWDAISGHVELCTLDDSMVVCLRYDECMARQLEDEEEE